MRKRNIFNTRKSYYVRGKGKSEIKENCIKSLENTMEDEQYITRIDKL